MQSFFYAFNMNMQQQTSIKHVNDNQYSHKKNLRVFQQVNLLFLTITLNGPENTFKLINNQVWDIICGVKLMQFWPEDNFSSGLRTKC